MFKKISKSISSMFKSLFSRRNSLDDLTDSINNNEVIVSPSKQIVKNFFANKLGVLGLVTFVLIFVVVFGSTSFTQYDEYNFETVLQNLPPKRGYLKVPSSLEGTKLVDIQSGISFSIGLDSEGKVYFWGANPPQYDVSEIVEKTEGKQVIAIAAGDTHALALTSNNELIGAGNNDFNQAEADFTLSSQLLGKKITQLDAGVRFSVALLNNNRIVAWGATLPNELNTVPSRIQGRVKQFAVGMVNIVVVLDDGTVDVLGRAGTPVYGIPAQLKDGSVKVESVYVASNTAVALDSNGKLHIWGDTTGGMELPSNLPTNIEKIVTSRQGFFIKTTDNKLVSWGRDKFGIISDTPETNVKDVYADYFQGYIVDNNDNIISWGNNGYLLGTDDLGRDIAERLLQGGRVSLIVGAIAVLISTSIGVLVGVIAGFNGKWIDNILMRIAEVFSAFPFLPLAITLSVLLPPNTSQNTKLVMIMVILGALSWPAVARLVRGQILAEREKDFVLAARALGLKERVIIVKHILPSVFNFIIVSMTLSYAGNLLTEAGLSFLGFGVVPPTPSWGNMLSGISGTTVIEFYWWRWLFPALCVLLAALSVNLIGDALRDAIDPKSNQK